MWTSTKQIKERLKKAGLSHSEIHCRAVLTQHKEIDHISIMIRDYSIEPNRLNRIIAKLVIVEKFHVTVVYHPNGKRYIHVQEDYTGLGKIRSIKL